MNNPENALHESRLSTTLHDLAGPMLTARGFTAELRFARETALALLTALPSDTSPEVLQGLKDQIDTEMNHCLFRIDESLSKLDASIERMRSS